MKIITHNNNDYVLMYPLDEEGKNYDLGIVAKLKYCLWLKDDTLKQVTKEEWKATQRGGNVIDKITQYDIINNYIYGMTESQAFEIIREYEKSIAASGHEQQQELQPLDTISALNNMYKQKEEEQHEIAKGICYNADNEQRTLTAREIMQFMKHQSNEHRAREIVDLLDKLYNLVNGWQK